MRLKKLIPYAILALCILVLLAPAFRPGRLMSQFHPSRLAEVHSLEQRCLGQQGWISGWDNRFLCGYPAGLYQYQLSFLLMESLHRLSGLSLDFCYKLLFVAGIYFAAAMMLQLLRPRVGPWLALAFTLAMFFSASILWQIEWGYWNHVMALGLFCLFVDRLAETERLDLRGMLILSGIYALIIPTHQFTAIACGLILLGWLPQFIRRQGWAVLMPWAAIPLGALLLTCSYSFPIIQTRHWMGSQPPGMDESKHLLTTILSMLGLAGLDPLDHAGIAARLKSLLAAWPIWSALALALSLFPHWRNGRLTKAERRLGAGLLLGLIPFIFIRLDLMMLIPSPALHHLTRQIAGQRFLPYVHFCLFLLAALAAHHWLKLAQTRQTGLLGWLDKRHPALACAIGLLLILTVWGAAWSLFHNGYLETERTCARMTEVRSVWRWLGAHNDGRYRVLYESTFLNYPVEHNDRDSQTLSQSTIMALGALETGMPQAGALLNIVLPMFERTRTSNGTIMGQPVSQTSTSQIKPLLKEGNFGYMVSCSQPLFLLLSRDPAFRQRAVFGQFTIFSYAEAPGNWAALDGNGPAEITFDPLNDAHLTVRLNNAPAGRRLIIRQTWHPFWRATINGQPLALSATSFGQIQAPLDREGPLLIELRYQARFPILILINILALIGWVVACWITHAQAQGIPLFRPPIDQKVIEPSEPRSDFSLHYKK